MPQKHEKSFSSQPLFVKLELCRLCTSMPNQICVTGNAIHESHWSVQCYVLGYVIKDEIDYRVLLFLLQSMKCAPMCFRVPVGPQCWVPLPWKTGSLFGPYFKDRPQWLKKRPRYLSRGTRDSIVMSAHVFLVFLGHLIFWMGMFKVFRSNGLEILIPKHIWNSIIEPLEQI